MCFSEVQSKKCSLRKSSICCKIEQSASVMKLKPAIKILLLYPCKSTVVLFELSCTQKLISVNGLMPLLSGTREGIRIPVPNSRVTLFHQGNAVATGDLLAALNSAGPLTCCAAVALTRCDKHLNVTKGFMCNA